MLSTKSNGKTSLRAKGILVYIFIECLLAKCKIWFSARLADSLESHCFDTHHSKSIRSWLMHSTKHLLHILSQFSHSDLRYMDFRQHQHFRIHTKTIPSIFVAYRWTAFIFHLAFFYCNLPFRCPHCLFGMNRRVFTVWLLERSCGVLGCSIHSTRTHKWWEYIGFLPVYA